MKRFRIRGSVCGLLAAGLSMLGISQVRAQAGEPSNDFFMVSAGLGINAHNAVAITDYINAITQPTPDQRIDDFGSAVEFYVMPELQIAEEWSVGLEYALLLKSHSLISQAGGGNTEIGYSIHMPTAIVHYLIAGEGYWLKLGGGIGFHYGLLQQRLFGGTQQTDFTASGAGVKIEAVGNTRFDDSFYASIGVDVRWGFGGSFNNPDQGEAQFATTTARMEFFNVGLKLGVAFLF